MGYRDIPQVIREFGIAVNTAVSTENSALPVKKIKRGKIGPLVFSHAGNSNGRCCKEVSQSAWQINRVQECADLSYPWAWL